MKRPGRPAKPKPEKPRLHYVAEWAELRGLSQADIIRETDGDGGTVSRWFSGTIPSGPYLEKLATLFGTDIPGLFHHPADDQILKAVSDLTPPDRLALANALVGINQNNVDLLLRIIAAAMSASASV